MSKLVISIETPSGSEARKFDSISDAGVWLLRVQKPVTIQRVYWVDE